MANKESRIERGITKLIIPHDEGELVTAWPSKGPNPCRNTYQTAGRRILDDANNLRLQTGYETALFANKSYGRKEQEFRDVKNIIDSSHLYIFQVIHQIPENVVNPGMYSVHDKNAQGRDMKFNRDELEAMLDTHDTFKRVRYNPEAGVAFAPKNTIYFGEETNWDNFKINGMNIAIFSPEGAENLAELGRRYFRVGFSFGQNRTDSIETRDIVLGRSLYMGGHHGLRLDVGGYITQTGVVDCTGHAFGVFKGY